MNVSMLISVIAAAFIVLYALFGLLKALRKHWIMTLVRLGVTLLVAIVCIPLTTFAVRYAASYGYDFLLSNLSGDIADVLLDIPVGGEGLQVLACLLVAPLLYPLLFLILHRLCMIIVWIVEKILTPFLLHKKRRVISLPVGAVTGAISAVIILIPLCGFLTFGSHLIHAAVEPAENGTPLVQNEMLEGAGMTTDDLLAVADGLEQSPAVAIIHGTVGKPVFNALTTARLDAEDTHGEVIIMNLERELCGLVKTAGCAMGVAESFEKETYTAEDKAVLFATADSFFESQWIKMLSTDALVSLADSWLKNEDFAGMARPEMDANMNPMFNSVLKVLASETYDTIEEDIHVILDVMGDIMVHDLLNTDGDYAAMVQKLGASGLLNEMLGKLEANPRLNVLVGELKTLSIRLVSNMLGSELLKNGEYVEMMDNVAGTLTNALELTKEERDAAILDVMKNEFAGEGFDVPDDVVLEMSDQIMTDLGADGEITSDELTDYLANHGDEAFEFLPDDLPEELPDDIPGM